MKESGPGVWVSVSHILPNSTRILEEIGASVKRARAIREKKMRVKNNENMRIPCSIGILAHKEKKPKLPQNEERPFRNPQGTTEHTGLSTT